MSAEVFISYAAKDRTRVLDLVERLRTDLQKTRCAGCQRAGMPSIPGFRPARCWDSNEREKALNCLVELLDEHHDTFQKTGIAVIYFKMERSEDAYRWLQQAIKHRESSVPHFSVNPSLKKYQSEPLFKELFKSINHPLYVD